MKTDLVVTGYIFDKDKLLLIHHNKLNKWLPVGGHIEKDETPDEALAREIKEETNLDIEILNKSKIPLEGNTKKNLSTPFYVNVHSVGDHDHCSFFYICKALNPAQLKINDELRGSKWVSKSDLHDDSIPSDVKHIALQAFELMKL
ncbi:MAG: NUDIX hydrolase [Nanoarchaeota archaeon]|nr:NUDIX hydrolase [Nanoarchaeota archaeon]